MAQLTKCDRCGRVVDPDAGDAPTETITARNVRADLCADCAGEVLDPWLAGVVARVSTVPAVPAASPRHSDPGFGPRPPQHGFTAAAIEAAQTPAAPADVVNVGTVTP